MNNQNDQDGLVRVGLDILVLLFWVALIIGAVVAFPVMAGLGLGYGLYCLVDTTEEGGSE